MNFDRSRYKVISWKNLVVLHWIINPGLAVNELLFGQRVPKLSVEDKTMDKPRTERSFVPCPHCEKLHDARIWSAPKGKAFGNWFGLYCPNCGEIIPCVTNIISFAIQNLTFPIWIWFRQPVKNYWLKWQEKRYTKHNSQEIESGFSLKKWYWTGIGFGLSMFIMMELIFPLIINEAIEWPVIWIALIIWMIAGLGFGYTMKLYMGRKGSNAQEE